MEYLIFADTEASNLAENNGEFIEICLLKVRKSDYSEVDMFHTRIKPTIELEPIVTEVTGITNQDLADSPSFKNIYKGLSSFIGDNSIITKMVDFETAILKNVLSNASIACEFSHITFIKMEDVEGRLSLTSHSNDNVAQALGIEPPDDIVSTCKFYRDVYKQAYS